MRPVTILLLLFALPWPVGAIGIVYTGVGGGGRDLMELTEASVQVDIHDRVAVTRIDQVFTNGAGNVVEGIYEFRLPDGAIITDLVLWIEGKPVKGIVMEKEEGRRAYDAVVRRRIDPALIEQVGERFRLSIFPFPAGGSRRVELEYMQVLESHDGAVNYRFPLSPEGSLRVRIGRFEFGAKVRGQHPFEVDVAGVADEIVETIRPDDLTKDVYVAATDLVPEENLTLTLIDIGTRQVPTVLSYAPLTLDQPGYFALWLPPVQTLALAEPSARSITFVVDISSSMRGNRMRAVRLALAAAIEELDDADMFNVILFSNEARPFSSEGVPATAEQKEEAIDFVNRQPALGLSNFEQAFLAAFSGATTPDRMHQVIFLTDGYATLGETDPLALDRIVEGSAQGDLRLFTIGVGQAVDAGFLRSMAADRGGEARFVVDETELEPLLRALFAEFTRPVFVPSRLDVSGSGMSDLFPLEVGLLAAGRELFRVGRYDQGGDFSLRFEGEVNGDPLSIDYPVAFSDTDTTRPLIPRLWAHRKVQALEALIDRFGPNEELLDDILYLGLRYRLVTRRTSLFAPDPEVVVNPEAAEGPDDIDGIASAVEEEERVEVTWLGRRFYLRDEVWIDVAYQPQMVLEDYRRGVSQPRQLYEFARLGQEMIVAIEGRAYRIAGEAAAAQPVLSQNVPNPFNSTTTIRLQVPTAMQTDGWRLTIHNLLGQVVRELPLNGLQVGENRVEWNGRSRHGRQVASGVYIYRLTGDGVALSRRMLLVE